MRKIISATFLAALLVGGCRSTREISAPEAVKNPIVAETAKVMAPLPEKAQKRVLAKAKYEERRDERVEKWQYRALIVGIACAVFGLILLLPTLFKMFGKTVPAFYTGGLALLTFFLPESRKKYVTSSLWRWGLWLLGGAIVSGLLCYYMDAVFDIILYTEIGRAHV